LSKPYFADSFAGGLNEILLLEPAQRVEQIVDLAPPSRALDYAGNARARMRLL
jgi:hypothetical protein